MPNHLTIYRPDKGDYVLSDDARVYEVAQKLGQYERFCGDTPPEVLGELLRHASALTGLLGLDLRGVETVLHTTGVITNAN